MPPDYKNHIDTATLLMEIGSLHLERHLQSKPIVTAYLGRMQYVF